MSLIVTSHPTVPLSFAQSEQIVHTATPAALLTCCSNADAQCLSVDLAWQRFTGWQNKEAKGKGWLQAIHPLDLPRFLRIYHAASAARLSFSAEYRLRQANGQYAHFRHDGIPASTANGAFIHYINVLIDVTESQNLQEKMNACQAELEQIHETQARLRDVMVVAHTVRHLAMQMDFIVDQAVHLMQAQAGVIYKALPNPTEFVPWASTGLPEAYLRQVVITLGQGCSGRAAQERRLIIGAGLDLNMSTTPNNWGLASDLGHLLDSFVGSIAVPIEVHGRVLAILAVYRQTQSPFCPQAQAMIGAIAAQAGLAISALAHTNPL